jgi:hypothetical protein
MFLVRIHTDPLCPLRLCGSIGFIYFKGGKVFLIEINDCYYHYIFIYKGTSGGK